MPLHPYRFDELTPLDDLALVRLARAALPEGEPGRETAKRCVGLVVLRQRDLLRSVIAAKVPPGAIDDVESDVLLRFSRSGALPMSLMGQRLQLHPTSITNIVDPSGVEDNRHVYSAWVTMFRRGEDERKNHGNAPPTRMGGYGLWTGLGQVCIEGTLTRSPLYSAVFLVQISFIASICSRIFLRCTIISIKPCSSRNSAV